MKNRNVACEWTETKLCWYLTLVFNMKKGMKESYKYYWITNIRIMLPDLQISFMLS